LWQACHDNAGCGWETVDDWSSCSNQCGLGARTRVVACSGSGHCAGERPAAAEECRSVSGCHWSLTAWSACSAGSVGAGASACGPKLRNVTCPSGNSTDCSASGRPETTMTCDVAPCGETVAQESFRIRLTFGSSLTDDEEALVVEKVRLSVMTLLGILSDSVTVRVVEAGRRLDETLQSSLEIEVRVLDTTVASLAMLSSDSGQNWLVTSLRGQLSASGLTLKTMEIYSHRGSSSAGPEAGPEPMETEAGSGSDGEPIAAASATVLALGLIAGASAFVGHRMYSKRQSAAVQLLKKSDDEDNDTPRGDPRWYAEKDALRRQRPGVLDDSVWDIAVEPEVLKGKSVVASSPHPLSTVDDMPSPRAEDFPDLMQPCSPPPMPENGNLPRLPRMPNVGPTPAMGQAMPTIPRLPVLHLQSGQTLHESARSDGDNVALSQHFLPTVGQRQSPTSSLGHQSQSSYPSDPHSAGRSRAATSALSKTSSDCYSQSDGRQKSYGSKQPPDSFNQSTGPPSVVPSSSRSEATEQPSDEVERQADSRPSHSREAKGNSRPPSVLSSTSGLSVYSVEDFMGGNAAGDLDTTEIEDFTGGGAVEGKLEPVGEADELDITEIEDFTGGGAVEGKLEKPWMGDESLCTSLSVRGQPSARGSLQAGATMAAQPLAVGQEPRWPTVGDYVKILATEDTLELIPSLVGQVLCVRTDDKDDRPYQIEGSDVWLFASDLEVQERRLPSVGDYVKILATEETLELVPSLVGQVLLVRTDGNDERPYKVEGSDVWLFTSDVELQACPPDPVVEESKEASEQHAFADVSRLSPLSAVPLRSEVQTPGPVVGASPERDPYDRSNLSTPSYVASRPATRGGGPVIPPSPSIVEVSESPVGSRLEVVVDEPHSSPSRQATPDRDLLQRLAEVEAERSSGESLMDELEKEFNDSVDDASVHDADVATPPISPNGEGEDDLLEIEEEWEF